MSSSSRPALLAAGAAVVTVVLWASAFVSIRSAGEVYSPGALALGRLATASVALGVLCAVRRGAAGRRGRRGPGSGGTY
ncbi:hypothetical protein SGLAM104S_00890 [Streptomyces glaucescens]